MHQEFTQMTQVSSEMQDGMLSERDSSNQQRFWHYTKIPDSNIFQNNHGNKLIQEKWLELRGKHWILDFISKILIYAETT